MNARLATLVLMLAGLAAWRSVPPPEPPALGDDGLGPSLVVLDQIAGRYGSVRFDHRLHVQMSSIQGTCRNCHHELPEVTTGEIGLAVRPCRTCHEPASAVVTADKPGLRGAYHRQCLNCHREWTHENACGFCHTDSSAVRAGPGRAPSAQAMSQARSAAQTSYVYHTDHPAVPVVTFHHADHAEAFGLKCASCHRGSTCGECHGPMAERPVVNRQQCYGCHSQNRCVTCHDLRERARFDHGPRTGWWLRPGHAALECGACHEGDGMPRRPASNACTPCHAQRWGDAEFDHGRTGVVLDGDHAYFECLDCHRGGDERMIARCTTCHTQQPVAGLRRVGRELGH